MPSRDVSGQPRVPAGSDDGGQWTDGGWAGAASKLAAAREAGKASSKARRALATHKPSTKEKQDIATAAEMRIAKMLGAKPTGNNLPVDVHVKAANGKTYGVEVKSISDNGNNKITMHPESLARKEKWARSNRATVHTVVVDTRSRTIYYRKGVGSFRLHTLQRVESGAHLLRLMGIS